MAPKDNPGPLIVEPPSQIRFNGPFTNPVVTTVTLINPTDNKIIFKIKTTAPSFYGVRPNFGVVQPRNFTEVEIARQPFNYNQNEKINHKFMVQSLSVPTNAEDLNRVWENADPTQLNATKLRCVFEMPTSISQVLPGATQANKALQEGYTSMEAMHGSTMNSPNSTHVSPVTSTIARTENRGILTSTNDIVKLQKPNIKQVDIYDNKGREESDENFSKMQLNTLKTDLQQLKVENSTLRKENNMLKGEIEQIRCQSGRRELQRTQQAPTVQQSVPLGYVFTSVTIAILSIFIGKYIL